MTLFSCFTSFLMMLSKLQSYVFEKKAVLVKLSVLVCAAAVLSACAGDKATKVSSKKPKEYFSEKKYGVSASPRVTKTKGADVRKGGGVYRVGKPYKIRGKWYYPKSDPNYNKVGVASWYGDAFHGRLTANGEVYNMHGLSAAHPTLPLPSYVRVTNISNKKSVIVRVNDRGPFHANRIIDLSRRTADLLGTKADGIGKVRVQYIGRARMDGEDDWLIASYMEDGQYKHPNARTIIARNMSGAAPSTLVASNQAVSPRTISDVASAAIELPAVGVLPRARSGAIGSGVLAANTVVNRAPARQIAGIAPSVALTPFDANAAAASAPRPRGAPLDILANSRQSAQEVVNSDLRAQAEQTSRAGGIGHKRDARRSGLLDQLITRSVTPSASPTVQVGTFTNKANADAAAKTVDSIGTSRVDVSLSSRGTPVYTVSVEGSARDDTSASLLQAAKSKGFDDAIVK